MSERYFVSYFGNFEGGVGIHSTVIMQSCMLETGEQVGELMDFLTKKVGYPIVILSLYHMCTVEEEIDQTPEWILGGCEDRCWCCARSTAGEVCQQCGMPLCSICVETRAGFCMDCPTEDYEPYPEETGAPLEPNKVDVNTGLTKRRKDKWV